MPTEPIGRSSSAIVGRTGGIFTTRSQDRPNPIAITECEVVAIDETGLDVQGVDMLDGTKLLDLKPPPYGTDR